MDKGLYLKRLETSLREKYPEPQIRDIISDYEDFFATGEAEGKSEAELCIEFGLPEQAAYELKSENADETQWYQDKRFVLSHIALVILIAAVIYLFLIPYIRVSTIINIPGEPVNFWIAMLYPMALEAILVLWPSKDSSQRKAPDWIPRFNIISAVLTGIVLAAHIFFIFTIPDIFEPLNHERLFGRIQFLSTVTYCGFVICRLLFYISVISLILYALSGHKKARWFLFLNTTLLTLLLNFNSFLSSVDPSSYNAVTGTAQCFLWAILPNLAAIGIYWIFRKIVSIRTVRREKAWTGK